MNKPPKDLQATWDQKLKDSGFVDAEDRKTGKLKMWHSQAFRQRTTPVTFAAKKAYFEKASRFLHTYEFESLEESLVWIMHADGRYIREIAAALKLAGYETNKDRVNKMIRRLANVMRYTAWE